MGSVDRSLRAQWAAIRAGTDRGVHTDGGSTAPEHAAWGRGAALPNTSPTLNFPITRRGKGVYRVACVEPLFSLFGEKIRLRRCHQPRRWAGTPLSGGLENFSIIQRQNWHLGDGITSM